MLGSRFSYWCCLAWAEGIANRSSSRIPLDDLQSQSNTSFYYGQRKSVSWVVYLQAALSAEKKLQAWFLLSNRNGYSDILTALSSRTSLRGSIRPEKQGRPESVSLESQVTLDARRRCMRAVMGGCVRLYERLQYLPMTSSNETSSEVQAEVKSAICTPDCR